jgi:hypothetical protein
MGLTENLTPYATAELAGKDASGRPTFVSIVKASYVWTGDGTSVSAPPQPIREQDVYAGDPAVSGLLHASDLGPPKPRVDVLLEGAIAFPGPAERMEVMLEVGRRINKRLTVWGVRHWIPGLQGELVPSRPRPVTRVAIDWAHSFGGHDPSEPKLWESRNPVGSGIRKRARDLEGHPAPVFEDPKTPIRSWRDRPAPVGFGPVAPNWQPRAKLAGTYDETWRKDKAPLVPADFDPRFFNVAPADQQLDRYVSGDEVRLISLTTAGRDRFRLPELRVPVAVVTTGALWDGEARVDTIVIEPAERRFSLVARFAISPPDALAVRQVVVGTLSRGRRRALESGKRYLRQPIANGAAQGQADGWPK